MTSPSVTLTLPLVLIVLVILHSSTELCATKKRKTTIRYSVVLNLKNFMFIEIDTHVPVGLSNKSRTDALTCIYMHVLEWQEIPRDFPRDLNNHCVDILNFF